MTDQCSLEHLWMPFSANRDFKSSPRLMNEAEGMYYKKQDGTPVLDGTAGLWCCNAGHSNKKIVDAIHQQAAKLDYAPSFQMGHPLGFEAAQKLLQIGPSNDFQYVFFTNSGSESVDTALKIALGYQQHVGNSEKKILIDMLANPGITFSREEIGKISGISQERSIDVLITRLRQKLEENPKNPKYLQTVRGSGYVLWIE